MNSVCKQFLLRIHLERYNTKYECKTPVEKRLTDKAITNFVLGVKAIAFYVLFNPLDDEKRSIFNSLASLKPDLILPDLMEKFRSSNLTLTEPQLFTSCLSALSACSRPLCNHYPEYVLEIMTSTLPGSNFKLEY